ncbi:DNRLRE domain-containing protein [bacterium]|nr:MAG: DNRLRE domain-containing protein [bacterium]
MLHMRKFALFLSLCLVSVLALANDTRTVIIAVIDGARYSETFGDSTHQYIPHIWNTFRPQGVIYTGYRNEGTTETTPGHSSIVTGTWQYLPNDGSVRPTAPTIFEYYRKATGAPMSDGCVALGKEKLDVLAYGTHPEFGINYRAAVRYSTDDYNDQIAFQNVKIALQEDHPRLLIVNFPATDRAGHNGSWSGYLAGIRGADSLINEIWNFAQADPILGGKTTLIVTNDHGRHLTDYMNHGDGCEGCRHIMLLIAGPDTPVGQVDSALWRQIDIAPTIGMLLGFSTPYATGKVITSALDIPRYHLSTTVSGSGVVQRIPSDSMYWEGTKVILRAVPSLGSRFVQWTGALTGSNNPDSLVMEADKAVTAAFESLPEGTLELRASVSGEGTIEFKPPGPYYASGTIVTATAHPAAGFVLDSWSGAATGDSALVTVIVDANKILTATFRPMMINLLNLRPIGQGTTAVDPPGGAYPETTSVTITATPAPGWEFVGWTGSLNGTTNPSTIQMKASREVKARFRRTGDQVWSLEPVHDSYVRGSLYAGYNYGNDSSLCVLEGTSDANRRRSYLQFDLTGVTGSVTNAALLLHTRTNGLPDGVPARVVACQVTSDTWTEAAVNWRNVPAEGTALDSTMGMTGTGMYYAWDVKNFVVPEMAGDKVASFLLKDRPGLNKMVIFDSEESENGPVLEIETGGPDVVKGQTELPHEYRLEQNYPNPFNPSTGVRFQVPAVSDVKLGVYDILGREVAVLVNGRKAAGTYDVQFDASRLASGAYCYRLQAFPVLAGLPFVAARTMLLVR